MTPGRQMMAPYVRVVILHLALIAAVGLVALFRSAIPLLVLLVAGKIALDLHFHAKSHRPAGLKAPWPDAG